MSESSPPHGTGTKFEGSDAIPFFVATTQSQNPKTMLRAARKLVLLAGSVAMSMGSALPSALQTLTQ
jgi:hypothetical protein